jgi:glucose/arabinose dehydrogenase
MRKVLNALLAGAVLAAGLGSTVLSAGPAAAAVPAGFSDDLVTTIAGPTALDFTPDGRMLVTTQSGTLRVVENNVLLASPAVDLTAKICTNAERGLLGIAVDPAFATNGFVFLYYSFNKGGTCGNTTVNRVARFVMSGNTLGGEVVLIDNIPSPSGNHNGGDLQFGKDGMLYVSVGDGGCDYPGGTPSGCAVSNDAARDRHTLLGKILRIDRNGDVPGDNPFTGQGTARCNTGNAGAGQICQETFAWGLRNPFRMAFDPNAAGTRFVINDVGQSSWEEIDLGTAGADYGWNVREGNCATGSTTNCGAPPAGMTNPIFAYGRSDGCGSITGGAFVPNGVWPAEYQGRYLFADYNCGRIFRLDPAPGGGFTRVDFATGLGNFAAVHLRFGPWNATQALYYTSYANGGQIRRISSTAPAPTGTGVYTSLTPARILDTRDGTGGIAGPVGSSATIDLQITGRGGIPSAAVSAVAMNVTVTQPTASGFLTLFPSGTPRPLAANLNFDPGKTVPNLVVAKLGAGGRVSMFNSAGNTHVVFDVAGWYSDAGAGNDGRLQPLTPARILDTRVGTGGGVRLQPGASLDMQVSGQGGVPSSAAKAAVLNVAATGTTASGHLTVFPTGEPRPLASTVNFNAGDTVSNRMMAKLGAGGRVTAFNSAGSTDVVVDVGGWYTDASVTGSAGAYTPLAPARILDTRDGTGGIAGPVAGATTAEVQVTGRGGVPATGVSAVIINATVTQPAGAGYLTVFPTGAARPLASDLNYAGGETRPNLVVVKLGADGRVSVFPQVDTHLVFDVAGWFS